MDPASARSRMSHHSFPPASTSAPRTHRPHRGRIRVDL